MAASGSSALEREFLQAIADFKTNANLSPKELQDFQLTKLSDLEAAMSLLQQRQSQTKRLRYMKRMEPFLETMKDYGKVVEIFLNTSNILAFVWGPLKYIILVASNFSDAFNSILDLYETMGEHMPLLSSYQSLFVSKAYMRTVLVMIFQDILKFHLEALRYFKQKLWRQLFQATWKDLLLKVQRLKDNFVRHRQLIESGASLAEIEELRDLQRLAEKRFEEQRSEELDRRKTAILHWLSPAPIEAVHDRHVAARATNPESGAWLLNDNRFKQWFDVNFCSTPLLWLSGKPGAGKSVLASRVIDEARKIQGASVAFFYCNENDPSRNTFTSVARGLLSQLLAQDESLLLQMDKQRLDSHEATLSRSGLAKDLLKVALRRRKSYIIIDGIDECVRDQRKEICLFFRQVVESLPRANMDEIRCLFVSQDDGIARKDLSTITALPITAKDNRDDIEAFARYWEAKIETRFGAFPKDVLDITKVVTEMSHGMFIFANCVLKELFHQPSRQALLDEWKADKFPKDLQEAYRRILKRILSSGPESRRNISKTLLSWLSSAKRPLRWYEIQGAISHDLERGNINSEGRRLVDDSKDLCESFVEIHALHQTVDLVHPTVKEFLVREKIVNLAAAHYDLASLSIRYLCFPAILSTADVPETETHLLSGQYAFYDYAVASWVPHLLAWLREPDDKDITEIGEDIEAFLDLHYTEGPKASKFDVSKTMEETLISLRPLSCYPFLAQTIIWSRKSFLIDNKDASGHQYLDLPNITNNIRLALEKLAECGVPVTKKTLELYHGIGLFRCPKVYCQHFYKGFLTRSDRDKHIDRHDRPYTCSFEGCPTATFGCVSKQDLEKHKLQYHGNQLDFPVVPNPNSDSAQRYTETPEKRFQCDDCSKMFTAGHNLRSHMRTHTGERPFACEYCGKTFVRDNDKKRHQGTCKKGPGEVNKWTIGQPSSSVGSLAD